MIEVPQAWADAVARIGAASWRRLAVLGERDQGKSTFCRVLLARLEASGAAAWLLDADVGQKMVGPPACVTLAEQEAGDLRLRRIRFVGDTNPALAMPAAVAAAARLSHVEDEARLVVNTSGFVAGPGIALQRSTLDALDPELIVSVGESEALDAVLEAQPQDRLIRLAPSPAARRKSARAREASRLAAFGEVLRGAAWRPVGAAVIEDLHRAPPPADRLRLCGLADRGGEDLTLGLFDPQQALLLSSLAPPRVHRLRLGMAAPDELLRALFGGVSSPRERVEDGKRNLMVAHTPPPCEQTRNHEVAQMTDRIEKTLELKAPLERVWRALTDAEQFGQWFRVKLEGPFTPGAETVGRVLYPGYEHMVFRCRTAAIEPMRRFAFTWHPAPIDPATDYAQEPPTRVEFRLEPTAGGVRLQVVESGFDALPPHRREEAFPRNEHGWTLQMQNIRDHVEA